MVFNHVYKYEDSIFQKIVPNYYFRHHKDKLSNGSYCGNDLDTQRPMVRHLIINCLKFFMDFYDVDGFRFDLLGIIDIETSKIINEELRRIKPDVMLYGEGWNMPTFLEDYDKSSIDNAFKLPQFAFFNDFFRDTLKGSSYSLNDDRGYLLGNGYRYHDFINSYKGKYRDIFKFNAPSQSINYVECHDNATLYDKISIVFGKKNQKDILKALKLCNAINVLACGVPFIHMGQEIGLTKYRDHNSYRSGDLHNQMDYRKMEERKWMAKCMNDVIRFRKMYPFFRYDKKEDLKGLFRFENLDNGGLLIDFIDQEKIHPFVSFKVFINPSLRTIYYDLKEYYRVLFNEAGILKDELYSQSLMINGLTVVVVAK